MSLKFYFSFGSNMDRNQMKKRTPNAKYVDVGFVDNYDLVFNRKGSYRPGGVASLIPKENSKAYGVVWEISSSELADMDRIEDPEAYERVQLLIKMNGGSEEMCEVYIAFPEGNLEADQPYLELIIDAAISAKLPEKWIDRIKTYRI